MFKIPHHTDLHTRSTNNLPYTDMTMESAFYWTAAQLLTSVKAIRCSTLASWWTHLQTRPWTFPLAFAIPTACATALVSISPA